MKTWSIRTATALYGLSLAIGFAPRLVLRARATDPISALKVAGYSSRGVVLQFILGVLLTAVFAIIGERVSRILADIRWAAISYCVALACGPLALMHFGNVRHVLMMGLVAAAIVVVRKRDPHFTRGDAILLPVYLTCTLAFIDLDFGRTPIATALRAAIAVFALRLIVRDSDRFVLAPLALFALVGLLQPKIGAAIALVVLFGTPFLKARVPRRAIYPIIVFMYPLAVLRLPPPVTANFFEDSHNIAVATEMVRGERPYRDIVPMHGLLTDGLIDYAAMKIGSQTIRTVLSTRLVVGMLSGVAIYCVILAATGELEIALLGVFLAFALTSGATIWVRPWAALFALAATIAGTRLRSRRWFAVAGALVVLACLLSIDFGVYSALVAIFAALRARTLRALAIGFAAAAIPCLVVFAIFGFAIDFIRVSLFEVIGGSNVYFVEPLAIPNCLRSPAIVHHFAECFEAMMWILALLASCAAFAVSPFRAKRTDGPWLIGVWIVAAGAMYVERGGDHFNVAVVAFVVASLWALSRYARTLAMTLAVIVVLLAQPARHVITVLPELREQKLPPLFDGTVNSSITAARHFASTLAPSDTFVDFTNSALLYSLLGRDCPLRQVEVAAYQSNADQRDVIARIEHNPHIRAALITFPGTNQNIDGVSNAGRAPLVWEYLQQHFAPSFSENGVVFWKRIR